MQYRDVESERSIEYRLAEFIVDEHDLMKKRILIDLLIDLTDKRMLARQIRVLWISELLRVLKAIVKWIIAIWDQGTPPVLLGNLHNALYILIMIHS